MAKAKLSKKINDANVPAAEPTSASVPVVEASKPETAVTETVKTEPTKASPKPTIVASKARSEGRANLVPINVDEEIRRLAYLLSERRGFEPGHEAEDWILAEREIRERYHQQSA